MTTINTNLGFSGAIRVSGLSDTKPSAPRQPDATTDVGSNSEQGVVRLAGSDESSRAEVQSAIETANHALEVRQRRLELSVDSATGLAMVSVRDTKSGEIVLQVPSEVSLNLARRIDQLTGVLVNKTT
jgi:flagellar protein FlaG